jgi:hypothetical protein
MLSLFEQQPYVHVAAPAAGQTLGHVLPVS